ncbi:MAG: hypothetical protein ABJB12_13280, partial [Pseudomonadota bacterium]
MVLLLRHATFTLVLSASALLPAVASAQTDGCWPTGTCESNSPVVAASAQAGTSVHDQATEPGTVILYGHLGFGTPYGVFGVSLDVAAAHWLVLEAGVGTNPDEGAEAGFAPRLRLELFHDNYLTLGSGISWAHRYVGHADAVGELVAEHDVALPIWSPGYFWNTEVGFEMLYRHFACRFYPGYAKVINFSS